ncbi:MAG TPA: NAD(+) diphosphatase [Stellaceae bacterium]|jgi:NAD+ diphosphatase
MRLGQPRNFYDEPFLDRAGLRRGDPHWLAERFADPAARLVPVWRSQNLFRRESLEPVLLPPGTIAVSVEETVLLGIDAAGDGAAYFAVDLSGHEAPPLDLLSESLTASSAAAGEIEFRDLRAVGPLLPREQGALLAYARAMAYWHARHRFCGVCGSATLSAEAGHVRRCTNPACAASHFPRTDPAVIMLVTDGTRCLLGRQPQWPAGMHSTLAGFVEPGESLEAAVAREVKEETGIEVTDVAYHSSQPWPFPCSIMLGFHARATTTRIEVDPRELQQAAWYERDWILAHQDDDEFRLPRKDSIARRLIEDWLGR